MKTELAIFDMDGTILDTLGDLRDSLNAALTENGFPARTLEEVRRFVGNGIAKLVERGVPADTDSATERKVLADFSAHYKLHCADTTKPYDGVIELLTSLRAGGVRTAVVSNKADFAVQSLAADYFPGLFDFVLGERSGVARKPAPDMVEAVLAALGVPKSRAVYIGDSEVDVATAANAGLSGIFVTWGFRDAATLRAAGGKTLVDSPAQLLRLLV